jgi:hypothetical protein
VIRPSRTSGERPSYGRPADRESMPFMLAWSTLPVTIRGGAGVQRALSPLAQAGPLSSVQGVRGASKKPTRGDRGAARTTVTLFRSPKRPRFSRHETREQVL